MTRLSDARLAEIVASNERAFVEPEDGTADEQAALRQVLRAHGVNP